ncbi:MAG TPA: SusC/RagA family TonB-linked outer membrane protein, partial [Anseongella sp.]|nr:SusC/RagA family TonB-linked outer membrane protein [Anseongella sp.]
MKKFKQSPNIRLGGAGRGMLLLFLLSVFSLTLSAQNTVVEGTVLDSAGVPLPGVSVKVQGESTGASTDPEGRFSLQVQEAEVTLIVSFLGYSTKEFRASAGQPVTITLAPDNQALEQVVVIGYGSKRKRDITSAVSVIDMEGVRDRPVSNLTNLMLGQAPGVVVKQNTGTPGGELDVNIRGLSSLGAGSDPLYVIDGFAMGNSAGRNLNPSDVESITVLKDAASTAIYGARGSNGVVLITTKSAATGEPSLGFHANYGVLNVPKSRRVEMMNGVEFAQYKKESFMDKIRYFEGREPSIEEVPEDYRYPEQTQYSTDWMDEILHNNAAFQNYNVTMSSGKGVVQSLFSLGYLNEAGSVIETGFERFNLRANLLGNVNKNITLGWNLAGAYFREDYAATSGRDAVIGSALWADPREPVYNEDGSFNDYIGGHDGVFGIANPVQELVEMERNRNNLDVITNGYIEFSFLKDFKFRSSVNAR